ncbi:MAG: hypothetical protein WDO17_23655 [Alphaproteobacteria bacterium]
MKMRRVLFTAAFILVCTSASALPVALKRGLKVGTDCVGPVSMVAPKLAICAVAGSKTRIWCANGDAFDLDEEKAPVALVRSLCNLSQII